ncbi:hypothetical protein MJH12_07655 [bacterium]|nr:hypothetical protein [bacterium]
MKWNFFLILTLLSFSYSKTSIKLKRNSLFAKKIQIPNQNSPTLVSFFTKGNQDEMNQWIENLNPSLIKRAKVKLLNVISPGGMFFMIPKKKVFRKLRKIVKEEFEDSLSYLPMDQRLEVLDLDIVWLGDYKRELFNLYKAKINQSTVILFDANGDHILTIYGYSKLKASKLKIEILKTMKNFNRFQDRHRSITNPNSSPKAKPTGHRHF